MKKSIWIGGLLSIGLLSAALAQVAPQPKSEQQMYDETIAAQVGSLTEAVAHWQARANALNDALTSLKADLDKKDKEITDLKKQVDDLNAVKLPPVGGK